MIIDENKLPQHKEKNKNKMKCWYSPHDEQNENKSEEKSEQEGRSSKKVVVEILLES